MVDWSEPEGDIVADLEVVFELTVIEYENAARKILTEMGLTYGQLAEQARTHSFDNANSCKVWSIIGDTLPLDFV